MVPSPFPLFLGIANTSPLHIAAGSPKKGRKNAPLDFSAGLCYNNQCWVGYVHAHLLLIGSPLRQQGGAFFIYSL
jgi:hypothetical protein